VALASVGGFRQREPANAVSAKWVGAQRRDQLEDPFASLGVNEMVQIFADDGEDGPPGNWLVTAVPDGVQKKDNGTPIKVINTISLTATGKLTNLIVVGVTLLNSLHQPVQRIALKWSIVDVDKQAILAHGRTGSFEIDLDARRARKMKCPSVSFAKVSKELVRNGVLEGNFQLQIGVDSARLADGSSWENQEVREFHHSSLPSESRS